MGIDPVAEIKARIAIEDLVAQYVPLKKAGRQMKALCPFHKERTPSFYVSPDRQIAYCFGCRKGGDHFRFIQEIEGLDFRGALELLADRAGIELPKATPQRQAMEREKKTERDRLYELHEHAASFFEEQLWKTKEGENMLSYFKKRGLKEKIIRDARLGYAPDEPAALFPFLLAKDFTRSEIAASGLAFSRDTSQGNFIDRFRGRVMFPIENIMGAVCAFGARAVKEGDEPKYLNSPETPIYQKNAILLGFGKARGEIRSRNFAVIVEGYMDALACHQAGFLNVVACSGTALTETQLSMLKRFTKDVVFSFDRDGAGKMATERALEMGFEAELSMKVAVWAGSAKDPDECLREDPKLFEEALQCAKPAFDYLLDYFSEKFDLTSVDGKKKMLFAILPFAARIKGALEIDECLKTLAAKMGTSLTPIYDELKRYQGKQKV
ncbi:DNA primase, partial [Candidatus Peregrinibacteria bacterium]|nr:DNA primase [Candidatus Peregrinibacteria bacterium]